LWSSSSDIHNQQETEASSFYCSERLGWCIQLSLPRNYSYVNRKRNWTIPLKCVYWNFLRSLRYWWLWPIVDLNVKSIFYMTSELTPLLAKDATNLGMLFHHRQLQ
jgi:hypothetical protein